jgi:hypothetical protein
MCNGRGKQICFGLAEKWLRMSAELSWDTIPPQWRDGEPKEPTTVRYMSRYSPAIFAYQLTEEITKCGADILFDCIATDPVMEGNICKGVVTESKGGTEFYTCDMLIDTTGDCDVLRRGGIPTVSGENFFIFTTKMVTLDSCREALDAQDIGKIYKTLAGGTISLYGTNQPEDVPKWSGLSTEDVTDYILRNHAILLEKLRERERKTREIVTTPGMPQFRTTCRIRSDHTFRVSDAYKHFEDSVCAINDFDNKDHLFEVPLRTLTNREYPNIITAGRSADGVGYGWDILRVIPPAILTGQAAGEAAALAVKTKTGIPFVDIKTLQSKLEKENVMVHFPDEYVPEDKTVTVKKPDTVDLDNGHY